jgi:hypothetical protein
MTVTESQQTGVRLPVGYRWDAPPFTRYLARRISLNGYTREGAERLSAFDGVVGVKSDRDPQAATVRGTADECTVEHGIASDCAAVVTVDPTLPHPAVGWEGTGSHTFGEEVMVLLAPTLPHWTELADAFWSEVKDLPRMPSLRIVEHGGQSVHLTGGLGDYEVHGDAAALTDFVAGLEFFADAVYAGRLKVSGTFGQFSIVSGASMKAVWNV